MKDKFINSTPGDFYKQHLDKILDHFKPEKTRQTKYLLYEGEVCNRLYYVRQGWVRTFFIDNDGTEKTSSVITGHNFGTEWTSFISREPSLQFIESAGDSELWSINYRKFSVLVNEDVFGKEFYIKCLESAYLNQSRKIAALMTLDAKERYQKLLKGNPGLVQKLSNKTLASFLDMREETLSRVKSMK
jgi:CRP-like cAMP-binding protein